MPGSDVLGHLTPDQVAELMTKYYAGEAVAALLHEFSIPCHASQLVQSFPAEVLEKACSHCGSPLVRRRASRISNWARTAKCSGCGHQDSPACRCAGCDLLANERAKTDRERRATVIAEYCAAANWITATVTCIDEISPSAAIALLALVRTADSHGDGHLASILEAMPPFTPTTTLSAALLTFLHSEGFILLDPTSRPDAFVIDRSENIVEVKPLGAKWVISSPAVLALLRQVERRALEGTLPPTWAFEARQLHLTLSAAECRNYFDRCLKERGLPHIASLKIDELIHNLLLDHSVAQALRTIWSGAQWTADFLARKQVNRAHASNYAIGACQRFADKARAEGWIIKGFRRPYDSPRSMLSYVLHDVIMKVGERGFDSSVNSLWPLEAFADAGLGCDPAA